jgi:uncharacterized protein
MVELPMIFVAGILGTAHCVGMCGPFALAIGGTSSNWTTIWFRQAAYTAGRLFTYGTLGAAAGFGGESLVLAWPAFIYVPSLLAISAGALLVYQGLVAAGVLVKRSIGSEGSPCLATALLRHFLRQRTGWGVFLAGVFTGLLPCGLLYGMLALAVSTHSMASGSLLMLMFGLGTAPAMVLAGASGRLIAVPTRRWLFAFAAWCLILTGAISVARGVSLISNSGDSAGACPMCRQ